MTSSTTQRSRVRWGGPQVAVLAVAVVATCAGLLTLSQADRLTAMGGRIADLEDQRARLHEQRAEALLALAAATDPRTLEARAEALGFSDPMIVSYVSVPGLPLADPVVVGAAPSSPLSILLRNAHASDTYDSVPALRMLTVAARPASVGGAN